MLLGMPWRPRAPPVVILRLRILGRVCNLHRTLSVVHRTFIDELLRVFGLPDERTTRPGGYFEDSPDSVQYEQLATRHLRARRCGR